MDLPSYELPVVETPTDRQIRRAGRESSILGTRFCKSGLSTPASSTALSGQIVLEESQMKRLILLATLVTAMAALAPAAFADDVMDADAVESLLSGEEVGHKVGWGVV